LPTTSEPPVIEAENVGKIYRLGELADVARRARRLAARVRHQPVEQEHDFAALDGVSFTLPRGECMGILGANGSGKSTLVQIISGITVPTSGQVTVRGRVLPLLEVGSVFHDELTGAENVELFGTVLGIDRTTIKESMQAIADFGGIDEWHMETPLKRYSTGMRARLSFAVATRFPADIYIFDEVMAVVDDYFRSSAVEEIGRLLREGRTVLFISHDLDTVRSVCSTGMWLKNGQVQALGDIDEVADRYAENQRQEHGVANDPRVPHAVHD
jgi:ABC-type polysaccharide/polyol phosphate transport system ATPase subunit